MSKIPQKNLNFETIRRVIAGRTVSRRGFLGLSLSAIPAFHAAFYGKLSAASKKRARQIIFVDDTDVNQLHPHDFKALAAARVQDGLYDRMIDWAADFGSDGMGVGRFEPKDYYSSAGSRGILLKDYELSKNFSLFKGKLRPGLKFHSGNPINSQVVHWNFEAMLKGKTASGPWLKLLRISSPEQIRIIDDLTFEIELEGPNPLFWPLISNDNDALIDMAVAMEHASDDDPYADDWLRKNPAGGGPYMLEKWAPGEETILKRWSGYWRSNEVLNDRIVVKIVPDATERALLIRRGAVDMVQGILPRDLKEMETENGLRVVSVPIPNAVWLGMNWKTPPLDNIDIRKAILYSIPYDVLIDKVWQGYAEPMKSVIPSGMPTHTDEYWPYKHDLSKARMHLEKAGKAGGFELELAVDINQFHQEQTGIFLQAELAKIGVSLKVSKVSGADYMNKLYTKQHQMFIYQWHSWTNDPFYNAMWLFNATPDCCSLDNFLDPRIDEIREKWMYSTDTKGREQASREMQKYLNVDLAAWGCLYQPNFTIVMRDDVTHWAYYGDDLTRYSEIGKRG